MNKILKFRSSHHSLRQFAAILSPGSQAERQLIYFGGVGVRERNNYIM